MGFLARVTALSAAGVLLAPAQGAWAQVDDEAAENAYGLGEPGAPAQSSEADGHGDEALEAAWPFSVGLRLEYARFTDPEELRLRDLGHGTASGPFGVSVTMGWELASWAEVVTQVSMVGYHFPRPRPDSTYVLQSSAQGGVGVSAGTRRGLKYGLHATVGLGVTGLQYQSARHFAMSLAGEARAWIGRQFRERYRMRCGLLLGWTHHFAKIAGSLELPNMRVGVFLELEFGRVF